MHNFKMICKMYREIAGLDKGILPVDFFCAILTGAKPFVNIWFTAKIIGMMTAGADFTMLNPTCCLAEKISKWRKSCFVWIMKSWRTTHSERRSISTRRRAPADGRGFRTLCGPARCLLRACLRWRCLW